MITDIKVTVNKKEYTLYMNELVTIIGYSHMASLSKLTKTHFILNDDQNSTLVSDSIISQCILESDEVDVVKDILTHIAYVALIKKVIALRPSENWYYTIQRLNSTSPLTLLAKHAVEKYRPLFFVRLVREYDFQPEHEHDRTELYILFLAMIILLFILVVYLNIKRK